MTGRGQAPRQSDLLAGVVAGGVAALLSLAQVLAPLDDALYDRMLAVLPTPTLPEAVIVAIDEPSFASIGQAWPWPRRLHAELIASLRTAGAASIGYDIVFADPSLPEEDAALAAVLGPDVVLAADTAVIDTPQGRITMAVQPLDTFQTGGALPGYITVPLDHDGAIRRLPEGDAGFGLRLAGSNVVPPPNARIRFADAGLTRVSFVQALEAGTSLPPDLFRGKPVLVGLMVRASPLTAADAFRTPQTAWGRGLMPGVEVQAHIMRTLASGAWIAPAPVWLPGVLAIFCALAAVGLSRGRPVAVAGAGTLLLATAPLAGALAGLATGVWCPPMAPALAALAGGIGQSALDHARERRARREITRIFSHYLAPELVRRLAEDPAAVRLGGERRLVTILFCDLRGFTAMSERFADDPVGLTEILNAAMTAIGDAVLDHGGLIDKFIGDCVMALWNTPADDPEHAAHAIAAGRDAIGRIAALSARLSGEGSARPVTLACGIGINTGECTVGNMGTAKRFDYTAIGDPVNLSARLESLTKAYGVPMLIGEATAALATGEDLIELDTTAVPGRADQLKIFVPADLWPVAPATRPALVRALDAHYAGRPEEARASWAVIARIDAVAARYAALMTAKSVASEKEAADRTKI